MKSKWLIILLVLCISSCGERYDADAKLDAKEYENFLKGISPYVIKKPDEISYEGRFDKQTESYYRTALKKNEGKIRYYFPNDTAHFFFFQYRDLTSLFEHYRGIGGYFKTNQRDSIIFMNILYHTPRLTQQEMEERSFLLFDEMIAQGNVQKFMGDANFIHTPNNDFYYNVRENKWDYTPNSSWKFLEEEKERSEALND